MPDPDMTREQALRHAATTAMRAEASVIDAPMTHALAHLAHAWVAIADRLPPEGEPRDVTVLNDDDVQKCGHSLIAWRNAGRWVHTASMAWCDLPPQAQP